MNACRDQRLRILKVIDREITQELHTREMI